MKRLWPGCAYSSSPMPLPSMRGATSVGVTSDAVHFELQHDTAEEDDRANCRPSLPPETIVCMSARKTTGRRSNCCRCRGGQAVVADLAAVCCNIAAIIERDPADTLASVVFSDLLPLTDRQHGPTTKHNVPLSMADRRAVENSDRTAGQSSAAALRNKDRLRRHSPAAPWCHRTV